MRPNHGMQLLRQNAFKRSTTLFRTRNRWYPPTGEELTKEYELVMKKESTLSARQRLGVFFLYKRREMENKKDERNKI
ncbi:MAG: hypothetical protein KAS32_09445 [Candidatus Peribacteraceae bacterium]|nr:hypothetical protein [Candidatus Peribacteraceae bacterium]